VKQATLILSGNQPVLSHVDKVSCSTLMAMTKWTKYQV